MCARACPRGVRCRSAPRTVCAGEGARRLPSFLPAASLLWPRTAVKCPASLLAFASFPTARAGKVVTAPRPLFAPCLPSSPPSLCAPPCPPVRPSSLLSLRYCSAAPRVPLLGRRSGAAAQAPLLGRRSSGAAPRAPLLGRSSAVAPWALAPRLPLLMGAGLGRTAVLWAEQACRIGGVVARGLGWSLLPWVHWDGRWGARCARATGVTTSGSLRANTSKDLDTTLGGAPMLLQLATVGPNHKPPQRHLPQP